MKRPSEIVTLADEIEHVNAYLQIEKARFQSRLQVSLSVPDELAYQHLPAFTLQPIVENAIKHGTSQLLGTGEIMISASRFNHHLVLDIEDNAGLYEASASGGLGMSRWINACARILVTTAVSPLPVSQTAIPELPYDCRWRRTHVKSADC